MLTQAVAATRKHGTVVQMGRVRPVLHAVLPFAEANEAVRTIRANRAVGKVILALP